MIQFHLIDFCDILNKNLLKFCKNFADLFNFDI